MLKKLLRYLCFSCVFIVIACAPKPKVTTLPSYGETDLTLEEVITKVSGDIVALKAITDIKIEKNDEPHSFIKASVLVKKPEWIHMRMYQLGILVRDFVIRDETDKGLPGFINLVGIDSPGLTAAPAIAEHVLSLIQAHLTG